MAASQPGAMFIAGGTDLVPNLKRRQFDVPALISLSALSGMRLIAGDAKDGLTIGAGATLDELAHHPALNGPYRALAQACDLVSTPQVRCMGTLGGNLLVDPRCNYYNQTYSWRKAVGFCLKKDGDICLVARSSPRCWAVSSSDSAPVALALNATVVLHGVGGERRIRADDLYKDETTVQRVVDVFRKEKVAMVNAGASPLDVVISPNAGGLEGTAMDPHSQKPAPGATVVLIPRARERVEFYRSAKTDDAGRFRFKTVVPGDYRVYVWETVQEYAWMDPDFMRPLETKAKQ